MTFIKNHKKAIGLSLVFIAAAAIAIASFTLITGGGDDRGGGLPHCPPQCETDPY